MSSYLFLFLEPREDHRHNFAQWRRELLPAHLVGITHTLYLDATESTPHAPKSAKGAALTVYNHLNIYRLAPLTALQRTELETHLHSVSATTTSATESKETRLIISHTWTFYTATTEAHAPSTTPRAPTIVTVGMTISPADSAELDRWYAGEHIPALARVPGWRNAIRLVIAGSDREEKAKTEGNGKDATAAAPYLAVHEWDEPNGLGGEVWRAACDTPSTRRIEEMQVAPLQRRVWRVVSAT
ncbi:hypothetical protein BJY01DRAFT_247251 [Aspergillus pseudoustus]|uniref:EthD domain-containing protein n=1 Tax=Aspergillus pseudoustus TaxID=1810923 RepID=A0ABR4K381_9EURO